MSSPRDPRTANDRHLRQLWLAGALPLALNLVALGVLIATAQTRWLSIATVTLGLCLLCAVVLFQLSKVRRALRRPGPEAFIDTMLAQEKRVPKLRAQFRASAATAAALYARPELAEHYLGAVRWQDEAPVTRAAGETARALVHYCRGEWSEGFARARTASALSGVDSRFPGAATSALAFDLHVALGAALCDSTNARTATTLETALEKLPLIGQLLAAWGLRVLALRARRSAEAERFAAFIAERAPHAALLTRVPDDATSSERFHDATA